jgi:uncharacterized membrane protein YoaK (UPF0700 family)
MTTNITRFMMDLGDVLLGRNPNDDTKAGERGRRTGLAIAGFVVGCGLGAGCQAVAGLWSLTLPVGLALVAFAMAFAVKPEGAQAQPFIPRLLAETNPQRAGSPRASASGTVSNVGRPR